MKTDNTPTKREIKFRAYDTRNKTMTYYADVYSSPLKNDCWWSADVINQDSGDTIYSFDKNSGELMQYTGLEDKNGKEIYDGDIVRWDDRSNGERWRVAVVEIKPDIQFRIVRIKCDYIQSAKEGHVFQFGSFIYTDTHNHLEIIGNIFENPELLNGN